MKFKSDIEAFAGFKLTTGAADTYVLTSDSAGNASWALASGGGKFVDGTDPLDAVYTTGNVGIGTTTPSEALDVVGKIALNDGGNSVFIGTGAGLNDNATDNKNVGIGYQALYNNTTGFSNIANGYHALYSNSSGYGNVASGVFALYNNTGGVHNIASGMNALKSNTTGNYNIASGLNALLNNTTGQYNVANGQGALQNNTTGFSNVASGYNALYNNTTGNYNIASGYFALFYNTSGDHNTASGYYALYSNTIGNYNIASGYLALYSNTTGSYNIASGYYALRNNTTGNYNIASGINTLRANTTGSYNIASGSNTLYNNTTGNYNIASGVFALYSNTTGRDNIAIGQESGRYTSLNASNQTSSFSIYIGRSTKALSSGDTNEIVIGDSAIGIGSNTATLGNDSIITTALKGDVGIGTISPTTKLDVIGDITITNANGTNATDAGSLYFAELAGVWGSTQYGFRINQEGHYNYLNFQSANATTVIDILTLERDTGNVGIGTTTPAEKLEVNGNIKADAIQLTTGAANAYVLTSDAAGNASWAAAAGGGGDVTGPSSSVDENIAVFDSTTGKIIKDSGINKSALANTSGTNTGDKFVDGTDSLDAVYMDGNVGIGTTTPSQALEVNGNIKASVIQLTTGATDTYVLTSDATGNASWAAASGGSALSGTTAQRVAATSTPVGISFWDTDLKIPCYLEATVWYNAAGGIIS